MECIKLVWQYETKRHIPKPDAALQTKLCFLERKKELTNVSDQKTTH
jgi:hypothetical protein